MKLHAILHMMFLICVIVAAGCLKSAAQPAGVPIYKQGEHGFHTYRIPALAVTNAGTLLAFGERHSWTATTVLHTGSSAYSSLAVLPNNRNVCLYETGQKHPYESILFAFFSYDEFRAYPFK